MSQSIFIDFGQNPFSIPLDHLTDESKRYFEPIINFVETLYSNQYGIICHTSGSTGTPKAIQFEQKQVEASAKISNDYFQLTSYHYTVIVLPFTSIAAKMALVRSYLSKGTIRIYIPSTHFFDEMELDNTPTIDFISLTPHLLLMLLENNASFIFPIRNCIIGGAPVSNLLAERLREYKNTQFVETYGMTETLSHIACRNISKQETFFTVLQDVSIRVSSENKLSICHPIITGQFIDTNDIVRVHSDKTFEWIGRADNIVNSGGIKIQLETLEEILSPLFPFDTVGSYLDDDLLGQRLVWVVEDKANTMSDTAIMSIIQHEKIKKQWIPKEIVRVSKIPRHPIGKILRQELRKIIELMQ